MKLKTNNLLETLSIDDVNNLTSIVKESLLINYKIEKSKKFTVAELWNIQRRRKNIFCRRFYEY